MNTYRLREFVKPADQRSVIVDTSAGLALGATPGLDHFRGAVLPVLPYFDGMVTSPGQARHLAGRTRQDAALLVRADWTNMLRGDDFVLPPESVHYETLLDVPGALDLGASAVVRYFLLGYTEDVEAECLKQTVRFALEGAATGLPLVVDVQPTGPRVVLRSKAIELGVSYAVEGGASGIAIPWPGGASFQTIKTMTAEIPVWVKPGSPDPASPEIEEALSLGAVGIWLGEGLFAAADPVALAQSFAGRVHVPEAVR